MTTKPLREIPIAEIQAALSKKGYVVDDNGCHLWLGTISTNGYGRVNIRGYRHSAHRASLAASGEELDDDKDVCHKCDVRRCINPDHLFIGTRSENMLDASQKGRITAYLYPEKMPRGTRHGGSKLTEDQVSEIRESTEKSRFLVARFGVCKTTVNRIRNGSSWATPKQSAT